MAASSSSSRSRPLVAAALLALGLVAAGGVSPARADGVRDAQYWLDEYGISRAWETTRGAGVTVAVIDTGIAAGPDEFDGAVSGGHDSSGIGSSGGRSPVGPGDEGQHGSWVASLLAGRGTGGDDGVIGVAPEAKLLSVSVGFSESGSTVPFGEQIADAVRWSVDNGASVINMSLTTNTKTWPESWDEAFQYAYDHDVVVVAAAGNRGSGTDVVGAPATIPGVLTVAGVDAAGSASWGASSQGITIGVAAPSEDLVGVSPDGQYVRWEGTSGAAPIVAGVAALVRAAHPELDAINVINRIVATARPAADQGGQYPSPVYGYGLVDADAAVRRPVARVAANPMGDLAAWVATYRPSRPAPTPGDEGSSPPAAATPLPLETSRQNPWLPTREGLLYVSLPIAVVLGTATLAVLGAIGATQHFRRVAHKE